MAVISAGAVPPGASPAGAQPAAAMDPSKLAAAFAKGANAAAAGADPLEAFADAFDDACADTMDLGGGDAAMRQAGGLPAFTGAEGQGQAMLVTPQGALPLVMSEQGPMALTPNGPISLQEAMGNPTAASPTMASPASPAGDKGSPADAFAAGLAEGIKRGMASSSATPAPAPSPSTSSTLPARSRVEAAPHPVRRLARAVATAIRPNRVDAFERPATKIAPAHTRPVAADMVANLSKKGGGGAKIGTTGGGDGN
ncbi:MAG TPA: hypothetical protein VND93_30525 [Myxococcales bacterium]|nr:hypothetical protein [Myxococcales bacterium]